MNSRPPTEPLLLMTPGPTGIPERVLRAGARPMIHHRSPEFSATLGSVLDRLRIVLGTAGDVLPVHTTGRGGMEAAICNLFRPGDELVACCNGKFGAMWATFAESYGVIVHRVCTDWASRVEAPAVAEALERFPNARALSMTHCDTASGVLNDVAGVCAVARASGVLTMIDAISSAGGVPVAFDRWGADFAVTASQKCLMAAPGLAVVVLSERAWDATTRATLPCHYWDFREIKRTVSKPKPETPGTTPVQVVNQLDVALDLIFEEGLDEVYARHERMAGFVREGLLRLDLRLQCPGLQLSPTLTAVAAPGSVAPETIRSGLRARGILVAAGLGPYQSTGFRIGHMGAIHRDDVTRTLAALGEVMHELGSASSPGSHPRGRGSAGNAESLPA